MEKLVRDEMPYLCVKNKKLGWTPMGYRVAESHEMPALLSNKLAEEAEEVRHCAIGYFDYKNETVAKQKLTEELADLQEVIMELQRRFGIGQDEIERVRSNKALEKGAFVKNIVWDGNK